MSVPTTHNFMRSIGVKTLQIYEKNARKRLFLLRFMLFAQMLDFKFPVGKNNFPSWGNIFSQLAGCSPKIFSHKFC